MGTTFLLPRSDSRRELVCEAPVAGMKWVPPGLGKKIGIPIAIGGGILGSIGVGCR